MNKINKINILSGKKQNITWALFALVMFSVAFGLLACDKADSAQQADSKKAEHAPTATADNKVEQAEKVAGKDEEQGESGEEEEEARKAFKDQLSLKAETIKKMNIRFARAEERKLSPTQQVPAEIMPIPDKHAIVGPRVAGRVVKVLVNLGDEVKQGQSLLILESDEVGRARADLIAAQARAEVARQKAKRQRDLRRDKVSSQRDLEEAEGALKVAEADLQATRTRLRTYGLAANAGPAKNPAYVVLTSPLAGTISQRKANVGQWVQPSETLIEVVDLSQLWVVAKLYEHKIRMVKKGQKVQVEVRAFPGEVIHGQVDEIDATLDESTRSATLRIIIGNEQGQKHRRLLPGMFASVRVLDMHDHAPRPMLAIPWAAIQELDGHDSVFVRIAPTRFELHRVHVGERAGEDVEILNGLKAGDEVVGEGSFLLKSELLKSSLGEDE